MYKKAKIFILSINPLIRFFIVAGIIVAVILSLLDNIYFTSWEDVLVEAHGLLFDLILFGVLLTIYDIRRQKKNKIERLKEELDDYRGWDEKEAMYRNIGIIRRLNNLGISKINLNKSYLSGADLSGTNLSGSKIVQSNLSNTDLSVVDMSDTILFWSDLSHSILLGTNLLNAKLSKVNLEGADLSGAILINTSLDEANLSDVNLRDAIIRNVDLLGAQTSTTGLFNLIKHKEDLDAINRKYYFDEAYLDENGDEYFIIKERITK